MQKRTFYKLASCILVLILAFGIFIALVTSKPGAKRNEAQEQVWPVLAIKAHQGNYAPQVVLHGEIESPQFANIRSPMHAEVIKVYVREGQKVKANTLLIQLDDADLQLLLKQRKADVEELNSQIMLQKNRNANDQRAIKHHQELIQLNKKAVERQQYLSKKKLGSQSAVDDASKQVQQQTLALQDRLLSINNHPARLKQLQAKLDRAKALVEQTKLEIKRTRVRAPFNARISKVFVAQGERILSGAQLIDLYRVDDLEARAQIPSRYIPQIRSALVNKIPIFAQMNIDGQKHQLKLLRLSGSVSIGHGAIDGLFSIENDLLLGSIGRSVKIILKLPIIKKVYKVPHNALYGHNAIYIIDNNRLKKILVRRRGKIDTNGRQYILVQSDKLLENQLILCSQLPNARNNLKVQATLEISKT